MLAIKNLKIGIIKDLHKNGFITQKQMELAIVRMNQSQIIDANSSECCKKQKYN